MELTKSRLADRRPKMAKKTAAQIASKAKLRIGRSVEMNVRILISAAKKAGYSAADAQAMRSEFTAIVNGKKGL
jgi:hypothetical protein